MRDFRRMQELHNIIALISLSMGASWASGVNLYATILTLGWLGASGSMDLPPELHILQEPIVLVIAGVLFFVEFFVDKIPGLDSLWDGIQTFVRIPAGAVLAAAALGDVAPAVSLSAALVGGSITAATHATKTGTRLAINSSPEPFSNWTTSLLEDLAVVIGLWTALHHPWVFLCLLIAFIALMIWLLPKLWRLVARLARKIVSFFKNGPQIKTTDENLEENPEKPSSG